MLELDLTELPDTDALYEADDVILQTENLLSELFRTKRSLISAGGCSLAIQTMLRIASEKGRKIICARNAHRSAVNAMALLGIEPVWIYPRGQKNGFTGRIYAEDVKQAIDADSRITACYITSPDYYGELCDIGKIAEVCHSRGVLLLVDNAHGSHLGFMENDLHPIHLGADMTACSLHKTLPVLTGGAALNIADEALAENAKSAMSLFGSTSPSYMIMSSIDICTDYFLNGSGTEDYRQCERRVSRIKQLAKEKGIAQPEGICDPLRVTLNTASAGICGTEAQEKYFGEYGIDCEFCDGKNAVMICTPFNSERDMKRLETAIKEMPSGRNEITVNTDLNNAPERVMMLRDAVLSDSEVIDVSDSEGRTAADTACPCPPGVPVIMPGEMITKEVIEIMVASGIKKIRAVRN